MTGTIASITVFYFSQYCKAPTGITSWALRFCKFYSFILHAMLLYFCISEQFIYF